MSKFIKIPLTEEMEVDYAECARMADDGEEKDCAGCSLNGGENFQCIGEYKWCKEAADECESSEIPWE